jgi:hypothetical protein
MSDKKYFSKRPGTMPANINITRNEVLHRTAVQLNAPFRSMDKTKMNYSLI